MSMNHHTREDSHVFEIKTGIHYLPIPEPSIQLIKSSNSIEQNLYLSKDELNSLVDHLTEPDQTRYRCAYENLVQYLHESIENNLYLNDEILRLKHSIKYTNEILPIFIQNHRLAKKEKKIFYDILTNIWQKFDKNIQNEIHYQYQLNEIRKEHEILLKKKLQQEHYQTYAMHIDELNQEIFYLRREIQQMNDYKYQLENEIEDIQNLCSNYLIQLDYFKSTLLRSHLKQYNHLQLERDSILTNIELIKYNIFEHHQEYQILVDNYRQSFQYFRLTIHELEQELKQQTDQIKHFLPRQTIQNETENLIPILENKIQEKQVLCYQMGKSLDDFAEKIFQQKQLMIKKEKDYQTMEQIEQELNQNIHIYREIYLQLKNDRRALERQLNFKLKQFSSDDRFNHTLTQQSDAYHARKKLEQIRLQTMNDQIEQLIDENLRLKTAYEHLSKAFQPEIFIDYQKKIHDLKQIEDKYLQEQSYYEHERTTIENRRKQYQRKTHRISFRINSILQRMKIQDEIHQENMRSISKTENQINREQTFYFQSQSIFKDLQKRFEFQEKKRQSISTQLQITSNNIQHSQYRLKIFTQQFTICQNEFLTEKKSFDKFKDFHLVLLEQNEIYTKKSSILHFQYLHLQQQYQHSTQSLRNIHEQLTKSCHTRAMLGGMLIRRMNLCRLLYKKLARLDRSIDQREKIIDMFNRSIQILTREIKQIRKENENFLQRNDQIYLQILKNHFEKLIINQSHKKQRFRRLNYLPSSPEDVEYLEKKYSKLRFRLIQIVYRGMFGDIRLLHIQQEFTYLLQIYTSNSKRNDLQQLNTFRHQLDHLIEELKSKTAEKNIFIDYLIDKNDRGQ